MNLTAGTAAASGLGDMEVTTTATAAYPCDGASDEEMALYGECAYWLDGIGQILIGCTGFIGNCMAVPVLVSKKLNSIFNRILVFLAVFDNVYILCSVLEAFRKYIGAFGNWHVYAFAHFGYQIQAISILSSIFMTVVLALERYLAITKPIEYHNAIQGHNPWRRVMNYIIPVVIFSAIFNIPKFLEIETEAEVMQEERLDPDTNDTFFVNGSTIVYVKASNLRMDLDYIFWYNNLAKLIVTGLLPFVSLCVFNFKIYGALKRRRLVMGPNATAAHQQQLNEDNRQALVLFSIVIIFLISNVPRIALNIHEVFTIQKFIEDMKHNCNSIGVWTLFWGVISQLLMVVNSSINFFIYCFMSAVFREVLYANLRSSFLVCFGSCFSGGIGRRRDNGGIEMTTAHTEMTIATTTTTSTAAAAVKHLSPSSNGTDKEKAASAVARNGSAV